MRMDKFTVKSQEALQAAQREAESRNQQQIGVEHLLLALLGQREGIVIPILQKLGASPDAIGAEIQKAIESVPRVSVCTPKRQPGSSPSTATTRSPVGATVTVNSVPRTPIEARAVVT